MTLLSNDVAVSDTSVTVTSSFRYSGSFEIRIHKEEMLVTSVANNANGSQTFQVTRGVNGTSPLSHLANDGVITFTSASGERRFLDGNGTGPIAIDAGAAEAKIFVVNTTSDLPDLLPGDGKVTTSTPGAMSLRAAIMEANALPGRSVIVLDANEYQINGTLTIASTVRILGKGSQQTKIRSTSTNRSFAISSVGSLELTDASVQGASVSGMGGAILVESSGKLMLENSVITSGIASHGGAIANIGGSVRINASSIYANVATVLGGAIYSQDGSVSLGNATLSGNSGASDAGALFADANTDLSVRNSTIVNNTSSSGIGGIRVLGKNIFTNTIVASNVRLGSSGAPNAPSNVAGIVDSRGGNLIGSVVSYALSEPALATSQTLLVNEVNGLPTAPFDIAIGSERIRVLTKTNSSYSVNGTQFTRSTLTVVRAQNGTTAQSHASGAMVRVDGFWATGDLTGTTSQPINPLIGPLTFEARVPAHPLLPNSPAIDIGIPMELATKELLVRRAFESNNIEFEVNEPTELPIAPFEVLFGTLKRRVVKVKDNVITLDSRIDEWNVPQSAFVPMQLLVDLRGAPRIFDTNPSNNPGAGSGSSGGSTAPSSSTTNPLDLSMLDAGAFELTPIVRLAALTPSLAESNAGDVFFNFELTRTGFLGSALTLDYVVSGSGLNAADSSDFALGKMPIGTVSFAAGETSKVVSIAVRGDTVLEQNETFVLRLLPKQSVWIPVGSAQATILNNDTVNFTMSSPSALEGRSLLFDVTLQGQIEGGIWLGWSASNGNI